MTSRPPSAFLEELGWLTIRWSGLELMVETSCAYLFNSGFGRSSGGVPPKPFGARVKFIRGALRHPAFSHIRSDYESALQQASKLSDRRNDIMHGAFTSWSAGDKIQQTIIKSHRTGYIALPDAPVTKESLAELANQIGDAFSDHFNLVDRMKAIIRAFNGEEDIGRRATFGR